MAVGVKSMRDTVRDASDGGSGIYGNEISYMSSLLTFYLKGRIQWDADTVGFQIPNTVFGLIPLGKHSQNIAVQQITNVVSDFTVRIGKIIVGIILALISLASFSEILEKPVSAILMGVIFLALAASMIIDALEITLIVTQTSGRSLGVDFLIFDKKKAEYAAEQINRMVVERSRDTNMRTHIENQTLQQAMIQQQIMQQQTNAIVGAIQQSSGVNVISQQSLKGDKQEQIESKDDKS